MDFSLLMGSSEIFNEDNYEYGNFVAEFASAIADNFCMNSEPHEHCSQATGNNSSWNSEIAENSNINSNISMDWSNQSNWQTPMNNNNYQDVTTNSQGGIPFPSNSSNGEFQMKLPRNAQDHMEMCSSSLEQTGVCSSPHK